MLFLGVAYKPNINDERESLPREIRSKFHRGPALEIMDIVTHKEGNVQYHDPHIPKIKISASFPPQGKMSAYGTRGADKRGIPIVQAQNFASLESIPLTAVPITIGISPG